jgi:Cys-tRNA(Pro)/Cys-tRNA(Cys) deacylase
VKGALDLHRALLAADVPHEIIRLRRAVLSAADIPAALGLPAAACLAVQVIVSTNPVAARAALIRPVDTELEMSAVLRRVQARAARLLPAVEVSAVTGFYAGLVSPVCLPEDMAVYADHRVSRPDVVYTPTGDTGAVLGIRSRELLAFTGARLAALCAGVAGRNPAAFEDPGLATAP